MGSGQEGRLNINIPSLQRIESQIASLAELELSQFRFWFVCVGLHYSALLMKPSYGTYLSGSLNPASANPFKRKRQESHRAQESPSGVGS